MASLAAIATLLVKVKVNADSVPIACEAMPIAVADRVGLMAVEVRIGSATLATLLTVVAKVLVARLAA
jgi:hypothetical protein